MQWLEREHGNLRAALAWSQTGEGDADVGERIAAALWWFWAVNSHDSEARAWLDRILVRSTSRTGAHAAMLLAMGHFATLQGDYTRAETAFEAGRELYQQLGDASGLARSLVFAGRARQQQGDYVRARQLNELGLRHYQVLGDRRGIAVATISLGDVALDQGHVPEASERFQEALALFTELGDSHMIAWSLLNLGRIAHIQGDDQRAVQLYQESLNRFGTAGGRSEVQLELGHAARAIGDRAAALRHYCEGLAQFRAVGNRQWVVFALTAIAGIAADGEGAQGARRAARLFGAVEALREAMSASLPPVMRGDYEHDVAVARSQLGDAVFSTAWAEGQAMTLEQAIAYALQEAPDD